jgi:phage portal protein BeeE
MPVAGGDSPYLQQQNYSLAALAKRDSSPDPFDKATPSEPLNDESDDDEQKLAQSILKELAA